VFFLVGRGRFLPAGDELSNDVSERNAAPGQTGQSGALSQGVSAVLALPVLHGHPNQVYWAEQTRKQVIASFDRIAAAITAGNNRYKGLEPAEVGDLLAVVAQHQAVVLQVTEAQYFTDNWQDPPDRAQRLINADPCWTAIVAARAVRNPRPETVVPVRYMGFDDAKGVRVFKFGRLPAGESNAIFRVQVPISMLLSHGISFQDAPAMCAAIIANREAENHCLTDEDCQAFIALRPVKGERKAPRKKAAAAEAED